MHCDRKSGEWVGTFLEGQSGLEAPFTPLTTQMPICGLEPRVWCLFVSVCTQRVLVYRPLWCCDCGKEALWAVTAQTEAG